MKNFVGYYCLGASNKQEAKDMKGLQVWSRTKPNAIKRLLNKTMLGIHWVDDIRESIERGSDIFKMSDTTKSKDIPKRAFKHKCTGEDCTCKH